MNQHFPIRILMTADTVGGVWSYAMQLITELGIHNVEVLLATMGARLSQDQREQAEGLSNLQIAESDYKLEWMQDPWADVEAAGKWLLDLAADFQPDLIHLNGYAHGALNWNVPSIVVGHSCVLSWWQAVKGEPAPDDYKRYECTVREGLHSADAVVAPSHSMMQSLQDLYGEFRDARVIANGKNAEDYHSAEKENFILSAGRLWDEAKNVGAVCAFASQFPWPVRLAGVNDHPDGRATNFDGVEYLGRLNETEMKEQLARAAIYALPARYEPFGLSILEAALSECALLLGDIPSVRENWDDAALFVAPDDHEGLKRVLLNLIADPELRRDLGKRALERGRKFTSQCMARKYLRLYSELLSANNSLAEGERSLLATA
jgi:glycosyltransferase involved in cell wall biosynthesis